MRTLRWWLCLSLVMPASVLVRAGTGLTSLQDYTAQLQQLSGKLSAAKLAPDDARTIADELPPVYTVRVGDQRFEVAIKEVGNNLRKYAVTQDAMALTAARNQLDLMLADAQAMNAPQAASSNERAKLEEILARREFQDVSGETWWDRLKRRVQQFLWNFLGQVSASRAFPIVSEVIIWGMVAAIFLMVVYCLAHSFYQTGTYTRLAGVPGAVSERPWRDWQAEARTAAAEKRWRDAIHLSYWAGISFLEAQGLWRPDRARTPREYLRLLSTEDSHRSSLAALTRTFETVWYGTVVADEQSFATANDLLEKLGCR